MLAFMGTTVYCLTNEMEEYTPKSAGTTTPGGVSAQVTTLIGYETYNHITCTSSKIFSKYDYGGACFVCGSLWDLQLAVGSSRKRATEGDTIVFERL